MPFLFGARVARKVHMVFEVADPRYTLPPIGPLSHPTPCTRTSDGSLSHTHGMTSILDAIDGSIYTWFLQSLEEEIAHTTLSSFLPRFESYIFPFTILLP
ncbi:hypothetical protein AMTRI_Chr03g141100 [Amborella trichopoda]